MAKLTLNPLASLANETTAIANINSNSDLIEAAIENTISRDGATPNTMAASLDMDSNRILNLPEPISANEPVRLQDMAGTITVVNSLSAFAATLLDDADAATARSTLGLLPAATTAIGTSGAVLPLLNGNNTYSGTANFTDTTDASSSVTGAVKTAGGLGVAKKLFTGTSATIGTSLTVGTTTSLGGAATLAAGTTAAAPLNMVSGSVLTTPAVGAVEFDGSVFYLTALASSRQHVMTPQVVILSSDYTFSDVNTAQKAFNATTNGTVTVAASTTYMFEAQYLISNVGTTAHTWGTLFGGAATMTSAAYMVRGRSGVTSAATFTADLSGFTTDVTTVLVTTASSTSATEFVIMNLSGVMRVNGGGTLIPQVKLSAATTGASKMLANSYFKIWPIGTNTVTTVGNWT